MINPLPRLPNFEYIRLDTIEATVQFLKEHANQTRAFLGGTDTFVAMRDRRLKPKYLVDLKHLAGFNTLHFDPGEGLTIGAAVCLNQLISAEAVKDNYPVLVEAAKHVGGYQLRNRATLVGNLCNASPCGDTIGPSILYNGIANIIGPGGKRIVPLEEFFLGPGKTILDEGEIVQAISFPLPPKGNKGTYVCIGRTKLADLAIAGVTVMGAPDQNAASGFCFRIALTAVAPTVILVDEAKRCLANQPIHAAVLQEAAQIAMDRCKPISDVRASQAYRREMVHNLTFLALQEVWSALEKQS
jgi:carbon-monoxide dehydrogenase medium subunit